nr:MAG: hypothetical protein AM325_11140 [Candidatus Thorarchaeota archaeon SMTZ1-45]
MNREEIIHFFVDDHQKLENVLSKLTSKEIFHEKVQGDWTVKDIIAHISAWNWELIKQTDLVLSGKKPWYTDLPEADFNKKAVKKRESWSLEKVLSEWRDSFNALVTRMSTLSQEEWTFELDDEAWPEGGKVTVASIFGYRYNEEGHEGGHAKVIQRYFDI